MFAMLVLALGAPFSLAFWPSRDTFSRTDASIEFCALVQEAVPLSWLLSRLASWACGPGTPPASSCDKARSCALLDFLPTLLGVAVVIFRESDPVLILKRRTPGDLLAREGRYHPCLDSCHF